MDGYGWTWMDRPFGLVKEYVRPVGEVLAVGPDEVQEVEHAEEEAILDQIREVRPGRGGAGYASLTVGWTLWDDRRRVGCGPENRVPAYQHNNMPTERGQNLSVSQPLWIKIGLKEMNVQGANTIVEGKTSVGPVLKPVAPALPFL